MIPPPAHLCGCAPASRLDEVQLKGEVGGPTPRCQRALHELHHGLAARALTICRQHLQEWPTVGDLAIAQRLHCMQKRCP